MLYREMLLTVRSERVTCLLKSSESVCSVSPATTWTISFFESVRVGVFHQARCILFFTLQKERFVLRDFLHQCLEAIPDFVRVSILHLTLD